VAAVGEGWLSVSLVPHTTGATTLEGKRVGDAVNLECDVMAKYAERLLRPRESPGGMTLDFLQEHGF
jgi:riboflavin synthase